MRALVVSYAFPPVGGAGVQRVLKLVKYLPEHGITPAVLTVANPSVPLSDHSLERDIPPGVEVLRTRTLEPGYEAKQRAWQTAASAVTTPAMRLRQGVVSLGRNLLVPDPQILWLPQAGAALVERLRHHKDDVVFISGPPFSQFLLAFLARLAPGTAVVLDYRDEWTTTRTYEMGGSARTSELLEHAVLRTAHAVTTATDDFRTELLQRFDFLDPANVHSIPNGFDPDDFPANPSTPPTDRFVLSYVGTVFRLTSARPLLEAVRRLHAKEPELARLLEVRFIGRIVETEAAAFEGMEALGVQRAGYMDHDRALDALAGSHAVTCILDDVPGTERIYPAKVFELLYLGRPCLTIAPEGALSTFARRHALGVVVPPSDPDAIATTLAGWLRSFRDNTWPVAEGHPNAERSVEIEPFHRRHLAGEFAKVFERAVTRARGHGHATPSDAVARTLASDAT